MIPISGPRPRNARPPVVHPNLEKISAGFEHVGQGSAGLGKDP
jgi:hypothetical protein